MDDGGVDGALAALVGEEEGDAEDVADEPWDAVGGSEEQFSGLRGDQYANASVGRPSVTATLPRPSAGSVLAVSWV